MCTIDNESILKALLKVKSDDLTYASAIKVATEVEDATKVSKECRRSQDADFMTSWDVHRKRAEETG